MLILLFLREYTLAYKSRLYYFLKKNLYKEHNNHIYLFLVDVFYSFIEEGRYHSVHTLAVCYIHILLSHLFFNCCFSSPHHLVLGLPLIVVFFDFYRLLPLMVDHPAFYQESLMH